MTVITILLFASILKNGLPLVTFDTGDKTISFRCEIADSASERAKGLMYREELDTDAGMLFVFEYPQNLSFWMKNTLIPLDIIFIDESGTVINIEEAYPEPGVADDDLISYLSDRPAKWVLEVNQGTCAANGIVPGTPVSINI